MLFFFNGFLSFLCVASGAQHCHACPVLQPQRGAHRRRLESGPQPPAPRHTFGVQRLHHRIAPMKYMSNLPVAP